jgi:molybdopterin converting factor small subunit
VRVTLHAEDLLPGEATAVLAFDGPCTVGEAAQRLPLSRSTGLIILVNGKLAQWETALHDGDVVELIPALGGG